MSAIPIKDPKHTDCILCKVPLSTWHETEVGRCAACLRQVPVEEALARIEALLTEIADQLAGRREP